MDVIITWGEERGWYYVRECGTRTQLARIRHLVEARNHIKRHGWILCDIREV